jgi:hypothetical protein
MSRTEVQQKLEHLSHRRRRKSLIIVAVLLVAVMILAGAFEFWRGYIQEPAPETWVQHFKRVYLPSSSNSEGFEWFLHGDEAVPLDREIEVAEQFRRAFEDALTTASAIPEIREMAGMFQGKIFMSWFHAGVSKPIPRPGMTSGATAMKQADPGAIEVAIYSKATFDREVENLFLYQPTWPAVFVGALQYRDTVWFRSFALHELYHVKCHRAGTSWHLTPNRSRGDEEIDAHRVAEVILDHGTGGRYLAAVRDIASKKDARNLGRFYLALGREDFHRLDDLFLPGGVLETGLRNGQYTTSLTNAWLARHHTGEELRRREVEAYNMYFKYLSESHGRPVIRDRPKG